jgi:hypothetical protein
MTLSVVSCEHELVFHTAGRTQAEVFESRVLRNIYRPERKKVKGDWRKLHSEELHDVHSSLNIMVINLRMMRWAGHVAHMEKRNTYRVLVEKPEGKRPL